VKPTRLDPLRRFLDQHGLPADATTLARFDQYLALLRQANRAMNLIGPLSDAEVVRDLFCDSLSLAALLKPLPDVVIDVGSGAGFPGLPLKLIAPDIALHLVEPRQKRHQLLGIAASKLGLRGVHRHNARVEGCADALPPGGLVCSKAFAPVAEWLPLAARLAAPGGVVGVLCAADHWTDERAAEAAALGLTPEGQLETRREAGPARLTLTLRRAAL
jgi:16S rRNA (guanine527-N7)-methyltransferase